jgi:hypothetical protein
LNGLLSVRWFRSRLNAESHRRRRAGATSDSDLLNSGHGDDPRLVIFRVKCHPGQSWSRGGCVQFLAALQHHDDLDLSSGQAMSGHEPGEVRNQVGGEELTIEPAGVARKEVQS